MRNYSNLSDRTPTKTWIDSNGLFPMHYVTPLHLFTGRSGVRGFRPMNTSGYRHPHERRCEHGWTGPMNSRPCSPQHRTDAYVAYCKRLEREALKHSAD